MTDQPPEKSKSPSEVWAATSPADRRRFVIGLAMVIVVIVVVVVIAIHNSKNDISKMSCSQLASYEAAHITPVLQDSAASFDAKSKASQDAQKINERADAIGGCPGF